MIGRFWSAQAAPEGSRAYADHLRTHVLPHLRTLNGYVGAVLLQRTRSEAIEIVVVTWWRSLDAIRGFAGPDPEEAVVADEAAAVLTAFDQRARHYELVVKDEAR